MDFRRKPTLLTAEQYARDCVKHIKNAKRRVFLVSTTFRDDDEISAAIVDALICAARRNVSVTIDVDVFTYLEPKEFILYHPKRQTSRAIQAVKLERRLKKAGVNFHWLARRTSFIAIGRTHCKWLVADDCVYVGGGVNMDHESFSNVDYMFRFHDKKLADNLEHAQNRIRKNDRGGGSSKNYQRKIDEKTSILFDNGLPINSLIYRRAVALAKKADKITLVSQYCPTGRLNRILRNKNAILFFNHWRNASAVNKIIIQVGLMSSRQQTLYTRNRYLHAKFVIFEMPDGTKTAIAGSHNFMFGSGLMGTREVAIETRDSHIIKQLEDFRRKHVE